MTMNNVVVSLQKEYSRLQAEMGRVGKALQALGRSGGGKIGATRVLSKEARERIAEAQRQRWAKARRAAAKQ
jgi:hypothetical protein